MFADFISHVGKAIAGCLIALASVFGANATLGAIQPAADFHSSLTSQITAAATTMTLVSTSTPSGEYLVQGKTYGFKLGGSEYVLGTLSAGRQITSMTRGVSLITGTTTGGVAAAWGRGTAVEITDAPILLEISNKVSGIQYFDNILTYDSSFSFSTSSNQIASTAFVSGAATTASTSAKAQILNGANTFTGIQTFNALPVSSVAPTGGTQFTNKTYVDGVAVAGASNADTTTKGIVEEATVAEIDARTATGGTGAKLFMTPASMAQSTFASSTRQSAESLSGLGTFDPATTYRTYSVTSGSSVVVSAVCQVNGAQRQITVAYRFATDLATTSTTHGVAVSATGRPPTVGFQAISATTTNTLNVSVASNDACSDTADVMYQFNR